MMYTSQEGELYLSQARALGAIGVLPKQIKHADVSKALEQLHLIGETVETEAMPSTVSSQATAEVETAAAHLSSAPLIHEIPDNARERRGPRRPDLPAL